MKLFYYKSPISFSVIIFVVIVMGILLIEGAVNNPSEESSNESLLANTTRLHYVQGTTNFEEYASNRLQLKLSQPSSADEVDVLGKEELFLKYNGLFDSTQTATIDVHDYYGNMLGTIQFDTTSQVLRFHCSVCQNRLYLDFTKLRQINL